MTIIHYFWINVADSVLSVSVATPPLYFLPCRASVPDFQGTGKISEKSYLQISEHDSKKCYSQK